MFIRSYLYGLNLLYTVMHNVESTSAYHTTPVQVHQRDHPWCSAYPLVMTLWLWEWHLLKMTLPAYGGGNKKANSPDAPRLPACVLAGSDKIYLLHLISPAQAGGIQSDCSSRRSCFVNGFWSCTFRLGQLTRVWRRILSRLWLELRDHFSTAFFQPWHVSVKHHILVVRNFIHVLYWVDVSTTF